MIKNKKQMFIVIGVFCLTLLLGTVTYAFFNYTRTGSANTIKTGRIAFNTEEGDTVTLDGLFPITTTGAVTSSTPGVGSLQIHVTGDTTYEEGLEYLVKAVNVTGSNGTSLPISVRIGYEASNNKSIGTADDSYFANRGGNSSVYKVLSTDTIENNGDLVVGYIAPGQTGIDGYITIMAWLDASNIAITDTNPEGLVRSVIATGYDNSACETVLNGVANASTYCATASSLQSAIDSSNLTSEQITLLVTAGIVEEYTDGTTDAWVAGRTVFTTDEWNAMTANGVSFQVKVESNEGTWVEGPHIPTAAETISEVQGLETTPYGKVYSGISPNNYVIFNNEEWRILGVYNDEVNGDRIKIIKSTPYANNQEFSSGSYGIWETSNAKDVVYEYYDTLLETSKNMVEQNAVWNTGVANPYSGASSTYSSSTSTSVVENVSYPSPWIGKIGLIAAYEYFYAAENDGTCWNANGGSYYSCREKNWLWNVLSNNSTVGSWTLNPYSSISGSVIYVSNIGYVYTDGVSAKHSIIPVVYLKPGVIITGGTGESGGNEYTLGYTES